jgi:hypothetical protein
MNIWKPRDGHVPRPLYLGALAACLCVGLFLILHDGQGGDGPDATGAKPSSAGPGGSSFPAYSQQDSAVLGSTRDGAASAQNAVASGKQPDDEGPSLTRSRQRDGLAPSSQGRKILVDPMATWDSPPPWPEGPRLYAEVETSTRRYVNLRPDDVGELPRIQTSASERIELRIHFPDGLPGEKIFIEIPNGGSFPGLNSFGIVRLLPEDRRISIPYITDDDRGYCTIALRHRGHTRSLPIWVGELPELFPSDF